ncbi:MAG: DUF4331 domain-containing protein [Candidatus Riflebacteria bacterium]|nr:DUF4331 domain-containing protein [Candidatus Riflebacteria bacterium]
MPSRLAPFLPLALSALLLFPLAATASSHREAPLICRDPGADATDLYAFRVTGDRICLIANYLPQQLPQNGPAFSKFDDDVLYELKICNNGDALPEFTYQFRFTTTLVSGNTGLYNTAQIDSLTDADWNVKQTYTLTYVRAGQAPQTLGSNLPCPPVNVGPRSTPNYTNLANAAVQTLASHNNAKVFCGQREDPYFADQAALHDLLGLRPFVTPGSLGTDGFAGLNVLSIVLEVPITHLSPSGNLTGIIGVWTTASRQEATILRARPPRFSTSRGAWAQVSRLGNPLFNELIVPLKDRDKFNGSNPREDAQFTTYVTDPEPARLFNLTLGLHVPPTPRNDLVQVFLTGIPGVNQPSGVRPAEVLRLNMATPITPSPNPQGYPAGDSQGFPNGRRLTDDVTDIFLRCIGGALLTTFTETPNGKTLSDGVDRNDAAAGVFQVTFPYLQTPVAGFR